MPIFILRGCRPRHDNYLENTDFYTSRVRQASWKIAFKMAIIENPEPSKPSFRRKPESSVLKHFWTPVATGVTFRTTLVESQSWYFLERNFV
jgi:hypothetical protein